MWNKSSGKESIQFAGPGSLQVEENIFVLCVLALLKTSASLISMFILQHRWSTKCTSMKYRHLTELLLFRDIELAGMYIQMLFPLIFFNRNSVYCLCNYKRLKNSVRCLGNNTRLETSVFCLGNNKIWQDFKIVIKRGILTFLALSNRDKLNI